MPPKHKVYLEVGRRRVFAGALDWPGWCRSGRDDDAALQALVDYGHRYATAIGRAASGFIPPSDASTLDVVERLKGQATTDFGAPGIAPKSDSRPLPDAEAKRLAALLRACWTKFDRAAADATGAALRKGPHGGGRELEAIVSHLLDAERRRISPAWATKGRAAAATSKRKWPTSAPRSSACSHAVSAARTLCGPAHLLVDTYSR